MNSLTKDFKPGMQVIYVPDHSGGDLNHPDCEEGFVTSTNDKFVFCRFFHKKPDNYILRTMANSEAVDPIDLWIEDTHPQESVNQLLKRIEDNDGFYNG